MSTSSELSIKRTIVFDTICLPGEGVVFEGKDWDVEIRTALIARNFIIEAKNLLLPGTLMNKVVRETDPASAAPCGVKIVKVTLPGLPAFKISDNLMEKFSVVLRPVRPSPSESAVASSGEETAAGSVSHA